jgi:hypothetical protein
MATLITKNSSTAAAVPGTGDLVQGELAVNVADKKLYTKDSGGSIVKLVGSLGNQESNSPTFTGPLTTNGSTGTSGQVLISQGSGSAAQWASLDPGFRLLTTLTAAGGSSSVTVTGLPPVESLLIVTGSVQLSTVGGLYLLVSDNNGSSYSPQLQFTEITLSSGHFGKAELYRTKTASVNKPCIITRGNSTFGFSSPSGVSGIINALRIETGTAATLNAGTTIFVYGLG